METQAYFGTKRVAKLAGVEQHAITAAVRARGHWRGVIPRRLATGQLSFPALKVYQALGSLPPDGPSRKPDTLLRHTLCERAPHLDPFHTQQATQVLLATHPHGSTPGQQHQACLIDAQHLAHLLEAFGNRAAVAMSHEDKFTADQIRRLNHAGEDLQRAAENAIRPLFWRTPATATGVAA